MAVKKFYFFGSYSSRCDADAITYLDASGITDPAIRDNVCLLVKELKSEGVYNLIDVLYPDLGSDANQNKLNLVNPIDSDSAFRRTFSGGITFDPVNGTKGNGVNGYYKIPYVLGENQDFSTGGGVITSLLSEGGTDGVDIEARGTASNVGTVILSRFQSRAYLGSLSTVTYESQNLSSIGSYLAIREPVNTQITVGIKGAYSSIARNFTAPMSEFYGFSRFGTSLFSNSAQGGVVIFKNATFAQAKKIEIALANLNSRR